MSRKTIGANHNAIDLCKFIMAVFVVAIHTEPLKHCTNSWILTLYQLLMQMAVPFFFMSSGYLLASKFDGSSRDKTIVVKHLRKILKMYLIWSLVYLPLAVYHYYCMRTTPSAAVLDYIKGFLFVGEHYNSWHLWYLLSTIYALLFLLFLLRLNHKPKLQLFLIAIACCLSLGIDVLVGLDRQWPYILQVVKKIVGYTTVNGRIFNGAFYIPVGVLLARKKPSQTRSIAIFAVFIIGDYLIANREISYLLRIITPIALFGSVIHIHLKDRPVYLFFRNLSTDLYLLHMYIWTFYYWCVYGKTSYGFDSFMVTLMVCVVLGCLHQILKRHKQHRNAKVA